LGDAGDDVLDNVGGFVGVDHSVEEGGIDVDADVVLGVDHLVFHIDYPGLHVDHPDVLGEGVVVVESCVKDVLILTELLFEADGGGGDLLVCAAAASAAVPQTADVVLVALVAIPHQVKFD